MARLTILETFWDHVHKCEDGCWEWTRALTTDGYGRVWKDGKQQRSHRIAYELVVGKIPDGLVIDHLCRNKTCVNPNHLAVTTAEENTRRTAVKSAPPKTVYSRRVQKWLPTHQRILDFVIVDDDGCWVWTKSTKRNGYGCFSVNGKTVSTHRYMYEQFVGHIPNGLVIDHLCGNKICCNPEHLEAVTQQENVLRYKRLITHCPAGHEYGPCEPNKKRHCSVCRNKAKKEKRAMKTKEAGF